MKGLKFLDEVRALYVLLRSPTKGYQGDVYLDTVTLHNGAGTGTVSDWDQIESTQGWRAHHKYQDFKLVKAVRHSSSRAGSPRGKGVVSAIAIPASDSAVVFAGNTESGLFKSPDRGASWTHCPVPAPVYAVAVSSSDPNVVYAGCG